MATVSTLLTALHESTTLRWLLFIAICAITASFTRLNVLRGVGFIIIWYVLYWYLLLGDVLRPR